MHTGATSLQTSQGVLEHKFPIDRARWNPREVLLAVSFGDILRFTVIALTVVVVVLSALSLLYLAAVLFARLYQRITDR